MKLTLWEAEAWHNVEQGTIIQLIDAKVKHYNNDVFIGTAKFTQITHNYPMPELTTYLDDLDFDDFMEEPDEETPKTIKDLETGPAGTSHIQNALITFVTLQGGPEKTSLTQ